MTADAPPLGFDLDAPGCARSTACTATASRNASSWGPSRRTVEASEVAEQEWVDTIIRLAGLGRDFLESCTPGYYNNEGKLSERAAQNGFFGGGSIELFRILREWREKGGLAGLEVRP